MASRGKLILLFCTGLALVYVLVPYLLLRRLPSFLGNFLFWCLLTLGVIAAGILRIRHWGRDA